MRPLVLSVDPGASTGLTLLELRDNRPHWVDGLSTRGVFVSGRHLYASPREVFCESSMLTAVVVEMPGNVQSGGKSVGAGLGIAKGLIAAGALGGRILGWAEAHRVPTLEVTAHVWRKALCGKANATDAMVKAAVLDAVVGVPERSNCHHRDAIGVGAWALRGGHVERVTRRECTRAEVAVARGELDAVDTVEAAGRLLEAVDAVGLGRVA